MFFDSNSKNIFFTSDTHFFHSNVIKYCNRPFRNIDHMHDEFVKNWNSVVKRDDVVFHLGDVSLGIQRNELQELIYKLNGTIYLVPGNHDYFDTWDQNIFDNKKVIVLDRLIDIKIRVKDENLCFTLCHYAMKVWNKSHHNSIHLYGHSHNSMPDDRNSRSMDVGVDANNFTPISLHDVLEKMSKKVYKNVDAHGAVRINKTL